VDWNSFEKYIQNPSVQKYVKVQSKWNMMSNTTFLFIVFLPLPIFVVSASMGWITPNTFGRSFGRLFMSVLIACGISFGLAFLVKKKYFDRRSREYLRDTIREAVDTYRKDGGGFDEAYSRSQKERGVKIRRRSI
jgi:hypothetical protein